MNAASRHYFSIPDLDRFNKFVNSSENILFGLSSMYHSQRIMSTATLSFATGVLSLYGLSKLFSISASEDLKGYARDYVGSGNPALPYFSRFSNKWLSSTAFIASGILCGLYAKESGQWAKDNFTIDKCLQTQLIKIADFLEAAKKIVDCLSEHNLLETHASVKTFFEQPTADVAKLLKLLKTNTFKGEASVIAHHGRILVAYKHLSKIKEQFEPLLYALAEGDAYLSIAKLYKEFEGTKAPYSFVEYLASDKPIIQAYDFHNPFINAESVVPNSLELGGNHKQNIVVTGPNAGGKSTIIKALAFNLILAQSFGIAPVRLLKITPFGCVMTYLNITDDIAAGNSLFKAQVLRAHAIGEKTVSLARENKFIFVAMDELFNGTSTKEAKATAYSFAKYLGSFSNCTCVIATHFPILTTLDSFENYKVSVKVHKDHLEYPYKLAPGISDQHVALDMLKLEGFESSVLEDAQNMLN